MHGLDRDCGNVDQIHVTVHAAVEAEVAEVGGHAVEIAGVVAEHRDWNAFRLSSFLGVDVAVPAAVADWAGFGNASVMSKTNSS